MATISASPNPVVAGTRVSIAGTGYNPETGVKVEVALDGVAKMGFAVGVYASGQLDQAYFNAPAAGAYKLNAYQSVSKNRGVFDPKAKIELVASADLTVA